MSVTLKFTLFYYSWEQRDLNDVCVFLKGNGLSWDDVEQNGKYPCVLYGNLYTDYGMIADKVIYRTNVKSPSFLLSQKYDVLIPGDDTTPNGLARATSLEVDNAILGGGINVLRSNSHLGSYLSLSINRNKHKMIPLITGTTVRHLNNNSIKTIKLMLSNNMDEQLKIRNLFYQFDNLITLHQHKYEKLIQIKSSLLEKMFPDDNHNIPKIRFKGFTEAWEQREAKELCSITTGKSNTQDQIEDGKYIFFIRSDVPVRSNRYLYDEEAVITIGDGNIGRVFHYVNGKFDLHQRCYKMSDFHYLTAKYFYYFFSTKFYDRAMSMTAKATVDSVRLEMISDMDIWYPKELNEQNKISAFLNNVDSIITLHQREQSRGRMKK